jgi:type IV secretory pathway ATPase VirB11/archaellum biosynthesis ATPase
MENKVAQFKVSEELNMTKQLTTSVKFDENVPIADVVVKRLSMRCHLQRPPATFGELQGALRIMKEEPFTYPFYFYYQSMSSFFAGYDDVMVNLGNSEAVLGIKGCGKTSLTSAKICSIGSKTRIIAIQDIEEMPIRAYRKRGFHISTVRVRSIDVEAGRTKTLDLVTMANSLLRMGDAALIINEVRSREAVQGIINLLNTQPGVFLLYNLHAESLQEIQDRLELVFGIPSVCMLSTDRYTFITKTKFGRKSRFYRIICDSYESDHNEKKFKQIFTLEKGKSIVNSSLKCMFLKNAAASKWFIGEIDFRKLEKELSIVFIPPALERRAKNTSVDPEQYILQAFYKGKVFEDIYKVYRQTGERRFLEIDFVLKCNTAANDIMMDLEDENGQVDFAIAYEKWKKTLSSLVKEHQQLLNKK